MFYKCILIQELNAEKMNNFFEGCNSLQNLNITNFNTQNVKYMNLVFKDLYKIKKLDVSNFDTNNVIDMNLMLKMMN